MEYRLEKQLNYQGHTRKEKSPELSGGARHIKRAVHLIQITDPQFRDILRSSTNWKIGDLTGRV